MARISRTTWLKGAALVLALASLTINFGLIDLVDGFTGYVDQARNQVLDVGWGAVFGVVVPLGLLTQLRRPERRIAGIQQTVVVAFALALAGAAGRSWWYLALAGGIAVASAVLLALHPARQTFLARGRQLEPMMVALAVVAAVPSLVYAWRMASAQRRDLPPADAVSNGLHHWTVMTALALLVPLLMLLAAARTSGWRIPSISASLAAGAWAISCLLAPTSAAVAKAMRGRGRCSHGPLSPWRRPPGRERATKRSAQRLNPKPHDPHNFGKPTVPPPRDMRERGAMRRPKPLRGMRWYPVSLGLLRASNSAQAWAWGFDGPCLDSLGDAVSAVWAGEPCGGEVLRRVRHVARRSTGGTSWHWSRRERARSVSFNVSLTSGYRRSRDAAAEPLTWEL